MILTRIKLWLAGALAGLVAVLGVWIVGRRSGAVAAENKGLGENIKSHEVRNEVENRIDRDGAPADRLRERWGRD
jgi:hypothetical protein